MEDSLLIDKLKKEILKSIEQKDYLKIVSIPEKIKTVYAGRIASAKSFYPCSAFLVCRVKF